jgi:hypothetical protein
MLGKPRLVQLGEVAAHAEALQWRRQIRSYAMRAAFGTTAAIFGVMLLLAIHAAIWFALSGYLGEVGATFAVAGLDLVAALSLSWLVTNEIDDPVAAEARRVRNTALAGVEGEIRTLGGLLGPSKVSGRPSLLARPSWRGSLTCDDTTP